MSIGKMSSLMLKDSLQIKIFSNLNNGFNKDILNEYFTLNKLLIKKCICLPHKNT